MTPLATVHLVVKINTADNLDVEPFWFFQLMEKCTHRSWKLQVTDVLCEDTRDHCQFTLWVERPVDNLKNNFPFGFISDILLGSAFEVCFAVLELSESFARFRWSVAYIQSVLSKFLEMYTINSQKIFFFFLRDFSKTLQIVSFSHNRTQQNNSFSVIEKNKYSDKI